MAKQMTQEMARINVKQEELMHKMSKKIAHRIEQCLFERGMTHKDLAAAVHHSQGEVSRWLHGTHNFTLSTLAQISIALNTNILEDQVK